MKVVMTYAPLINLPQCFFPLVPYPQPYITPSLLKMIECTTPNPMTKTEQSNGISMGVDPSITSLSTGRETVVVLPGSSGQNPKGSSR